MESKRTFSVWVLIEITTFFFFFFFPFLKVLVGLPWTQGQLRAGNRNMKGDPNAICSCPGGGKIEARTILSLEVQWNRTSSDGTWEFPIRLEKIAIVNTIWTQRLYGMSILRAIHHMAGHWPKKPDLMALLGCTRPGTSRGCFPPVSIFDLMKQFHAIHCQVLSPPPVDLRWGTCHSNAISLQGHPQYQQLRQVMGQAIGGGARDSGLRTFVGKAETAFPQHIFNRTSKRKHSFWMASSHRTCEDYLAIWQAQASQTIIFALMVSV